VEYVVQYFMRHQKKTKKGFVFAQEKRKLSLKRGETVVEGGQLPPFWIHQSLPYWKRSLLF